MPVWYALGLSSRWTTPDTQPCQCAAVIWSAARHWLRDGPRSRAKRRTGSARRKAQLLGSKTPMTMSSAPVAVNPDRQRARKTPASRLMPMAVSSAPVRNHLRIGLGRASLVKAGAPYRSGGFQSIRLRRWDRILIAASYTSGRPRAAWSYACTQIVRSPLFGGHAGREPTNPVTVSLAATLGAIRANDLPVLRTSMDSRSSSVRDHELI